MILVLLGTQNNSFKRLLQEIEILIQKGKIKEEVIVQAGYTKFETTHMQMMSLIPKEQLQDLQEQANFIITHGGVGSIISSLQKGKKVIAIPRKHEYGEHVNNHQEEIVQLFSQKGYIIGLTKVCQLEEALKKIEEFEPKQYVPDNRKMLEIITTFIDKI